MINLNIFHQANQAGEKLLNQLRENYSNITFQELRIGDRTFLKLVIKNNEESELYKTINIPPVLLNCMNNELVEQILDINHIAFGNKNEEMVIKTYNVLIFDMSVISIKMINLSNQKNPSKYIKESECKRIVELAKKAIYVVGLDYAMVTIALTGKRKIKIMSIDPAPVVRDKDLKILMDKLELVLRYKKYTVENQVKLGADPEFMIFNSKSGKLVAASELFPQKGVVGCDDIRIPNRQQRPVAEIRPEPDVSPRQLFINIKQALNSASKLAPYRNVKWIAGSQPLNGYSIGGHIHFSNIELNYGILRALDNYVGIPVFLIENPVTAARRRKKYGYLADYRIKDYGGFEYRTPGSWLVSPEITMAVLCLAKIVASHYIELNKNYLISANAQKAFYEGNQDYFRLIFKDLWQNIAKTKTYTIYSRELQVLTDMVINGLTWNEKLDLRQAWNLSAKSKKVYNPNKSSSSSIQRIQQVTSTNATANRNRRSTTLSERAVTPSPVRNTRIAR